ncbi:predicted protein [Sclerotinia sclerotiorum 1980 UF-70]|uniref:Uncharacterized protein n=1 Tax=Sclerotinia sclerotiorum (strain ATCC 18683 / 1980 / Ss-1) TaxID=665079 RepID=A7EHM4_SCLS1|nr:predicted protein [Sclerotinia sclerotiorum 1980 UF-70]EDO02340.1 predicted protein [Sclerotinia sclerotiorum 1980 UF-70]
MAFPCKKCYKLYVILPSLPSKNLSYNTKSFVSALCKTPLTPEPVFASHNPPCIGEVSRSRFLSSADVVPSLPHPTAKPDLLTESCPTIHECGRGGLTARSSDARVKGLRVLLMVFSCVGVEVINLADEGYSSFLHEAGFVRVMRLWVERDPVLGSNELSVGYSVLEVEENTGDEV